ncbi:hypothetical protein HZZ00_37315 (plasmid) [Streptomyces sp. NEAU-sy36]|uniref:hypothetical protein n=1 Tax=unclassified Streptomyces TaxID=2593676 RepID=UPI0015D62FC7|nr:MULTISPECIES: hypothetical protein [unclassified Streptomyces]QLJ06694.1 hypothetical protein HZZ00_37315 [Streptomyces sp. NEAU-sy36]
MATFNFGGQSVDSSDTEALAKAAQEAGVTFGGSIVLGNAYGVSGGEHQGDVHGTEQQD